MRLSCPADDGARKEKLLPGPSSIGTATSPHPLPIPIIRSPARKNNALIRRNLVEAHRVHLARSRLGGTMGTEINSRSPMKWRKA